LNITHYEEAKITRYSWDLARLKVSSPQVPALAFINSKAPMYPAYRLKQPYALSVLHFSSGVNRRELSDKDKCEWFRIPTADYIISAAWDENSNI
jgi:hypothetical protein